MWCPVCGDEFRAGVTHCPDDGAELVSDEAVPRAPEHAKEAPEGYAQIAAGWEGPIDEFRDWLDDEGIPVIPIQDGATWSLYVPAGDAKRAQELLNDFYDEDEYEEVDVSCQ